MPLTFAIEAMKPTCAATISEFVTAVDALSEYELLGGSRCHGWTRLDVVVHVLNGWHEMLGGLVSVTDAPPTVDAATFWNVFGSMQGAEDAIAELMSQRRRTASYGRPSSAVAQLRDVAAMVLRGIDAMADGNRLWLGHVFTAGDYLAVWAVEHVIHQLDLLTAAPPPAAGLEAARRTVEALLDEPLPADWTDADVALVGSGRLVVPAGTERLADRLPVIR